MMITQISPDTCVGMTKRVRSDDELVAVLDQFQFLERLPTDVLYYIVFRSGLTVPEVHRLCTINRRFQHICQNRGVWDKLFIEKLIAKAVVPERELPKYYDHPLFQEWRVGRMNGMPDDFQRFTASVYFYAHNGPLSFTKTGVACRVMVSKRAGILWVRGDDYCNLHPFMRDIIDEFADVNDIKTRSAFVVPDANAVRFYYRMLGAGWVREGVHPILLSGPVKRDRGDYDHPASIPSADPRAKKMDHVNKDLLYKIVMRSGLTIRDIEAMCKTEVRLRLLCNDRVWNDLFVERILAKDMLDETGRPRTSLTADELIAFRATDEYKEWIEGPNNGMINAAQRFKASMFYYYPFPDQFIYRKRNVLCRIEVWQRDYDLRVGAPTDEEEEACLEQQDVMEILADLADQNMHRHGFPFRVPNKNVIQFHYRMLDNNWVRETDHNLLIQGGVKREREDGAPEGEGVARGMLREFHKSEELPPELLFKVIFESGNSVIDLIRLCSMSKELRKLCNDGKVWDKLYIDTFLARSTTRLSADERRPYFNSPQFLEWHGERNTMPKDMVRLVAHAYTTLRVEDIEFHKAPGYVLNFVDSALMDGIDHDTLVYVEFETKGVRKPVRSLSLSASMREVLMRGGLVRFRAVDDKAAYLLAQENRLKLYYELLVGGWHPIVKTAAPADQKKVPAVIIKSAIYNGPLALAEHEMLACDTCGTDKSTEWLQCGKCTRFTFCSHECSDALADVHDAVCINVEKMNYPDYLSKHLQYAIDDAVAMPKEFKASEVEDMRITHELLQLGEEVTDDTIDAAQEWIGVVYHGGAGAYATVGPKMSGGRRRRRRRSKSKKKAAPKTGRGRSKSRSRSKGKKPGRGRSKSKNKQPNAGSSRRRSQSKSKSKEKKGIGRGRSKSRSKSKSKEKKPAAASKKGRSKSKSKEKKPAVPNRGRSKSKSKEKKGKGRSKSKGKKQEGGGDLSPKKKKKSSDGSTSPSRSRSRSRSRSDGEDGEKRSLFNMRTGSKKKTTNFSVVMPSRRGGGGGGGGQLPSYQPPPPPTPYTPAPAPTPAPTPAQPQVVVVNQTDGRRRRDEPDSDDDRDAASAGNSNDSEEQ